MTPEEVTALQEMQAWAVEVHHAALRWETWLNGHYVSGPRSQEWWDAARTCWDFHGQSQRVVNRLENLLSSGQRAPESH